MTPKQRAGEAAVKYVRDGMAVGLGTGSTADEFLRALGAAVRDGHVRDIRGVPSSVHSQHLAESLGIPLSTLAEVKRLDVTIDGADEVDPNLDLIKGLGGALLREKIVAQNSTTLVIIADAGKIVAKLGTHTPLPVEVIPFAHETQEIYLNSLGATPTLRRGQDGNVFVTDNGNYIYDCRFPAGIDDPHALDHAMRTRAGIVETGLFMGIAKVAIIASDAGIEERRRQA